MFDRIHIAIGRGEERSVCAGFGFSLFCLIVKMRSRSCWGKRERKKKHGFFLLRQRLVDWRQQGKAGKVVKIIKSFYGTAPCFPFFPPGGKRENREGRRVIETVLSLPFLQALSFLPCN